MLKNSSTKYLYKMLLILVTFLSLFSRCTLSDQNLQENIDPHNVGDNVPAIISISNYPAGNKEFKNTRSTSNIVVAEDNQLIKTSVEFGEWIDKTIPATRTTWTNSSNVVSWSPGDNVGVYMRLATGTSLPYIDRNNVQHTVGTSGVLTANSSPIYFPRPHNVANNVIFYAYYPYSSTAATNSMIVNYTLPTDQSTQVSLAGADIMNATSAATNGSSPAITLPFRHQMVLLSFQVKSLLLPGTLTKIVLSGSAITNTGTLNLATSTLTPNTAVAFAPSVTTNQAVTTSQLGYVDIIVNPFTLANNVGSQLTVSLTFTLLGLPVVHTTSLVSTGTFVAGTRYKYVLTVTL